MPEDLGAVETDRYDRRLYASLRDSSSALRETEERGASFVPDPASVLRDFWALLYKMSPKLKENCPPSLLLNKKIAESVLNHQDYAEMRSSTRLDEHASALAAICLADRLLPEIPSSAREEAASLREVQRQIKELLARMEASSLSGEGCPEQAELKQALERAQEDSSRLAASLEEAFSSKAEKRALRAAVSAAAGEFSELEEGASVFSWGTGPGSPGYLTGEERLKLALLLRENPRLKRIASLAGRMRRIAAEKRRTRVRHEPCEVTGVELGSDLECVLPSELALLGHPVLSRDFKRRLLEGNLLQSELSARVPQGRGPVVVCLDSSGSMAGENEVWSKAVALALFFVAARERRAFACIHFGSKEELRTFRFPDPKKAPPSEVAEMASFFYGGGTDFEAPLKEALRVLTESPFSKGDVVFVTDGCCRVPDSFLEEFRRVKADKGFSVISVLMPGGLRLGVELFSDRIAFAAPGSDSEALDLVFSF